MGGVERRIWYLAWYLRTEEPSLRKLCGVRVARPRSVEVPLRGRSLCVPCLRLDEHRRDAGRGRLRERRMTESVPRPERVLNSCAGECAPCVLPEL